MKVLQKTPDAKRVCPECGAAITLRGMFGHLRFKHDVHLPLEELRALPLAKSALRAQAKQRKQEQKDDIGETLLKWGGLAILTCILWTPVKAILKNLGRIAGGIR